MELYNNFRIILSVTKFNGSSFEDNSDITWTVEATQESYTSTENYFYIQINAFDFTEIQFIGVHWMVVYGNDFLLSGYRGLTEDYNNSTSK